MTARLAGLLERLRMLGSYGHKPYPTHWINPDGQEAAAAIEDLLARIAALESKEAELVGLVERARQRLAPKYVNWHVAARAALTLKENDDGQ